MFPAISNLDISWPDPSTGGLDQIQKSIQAQNQYQLQTGSNDAAAAGGTFTGGSFYFLGAAISKAGVITLAPLSAGAAQFYNTVTNSNSAGAALTNKLSVEYCEFNDTFYYSGAAGLHKISASNTGSAATLITGSAFRQGYVNGHLIYFGPAVDNGPLRILDTRTDTFTTLASTLLATDTVTTLAPNGILFFGSGRTTHQFFDLSTNTTGTCTGTTVADSAYGWILAGDGNLYAVPRFRNTRVYKLDPNTKTITNVLTDANYNGSNAKRGQWIGPDGNIWTYDSVTSNRMYVYNWRTNQMTVAPYTYTAGATQSAYWGCVSGFDAMYLTPWSLNPGQFRKYAANIGMSNYYNGARLGNTNTQMY